ncbi:hypothetical protein EOD39_10040 [Acipenser ruthenus]|uniref:Uncharacterized protein n=1 Tax=Acipenser ruthenus TaxID=7906 RepID=A0A444TYY3_ACIRT|nr:hypothetical protein EOD39_10040 [Acipenser ruthenus]
MESKESDAATKSPSEQSHWGEPSRGAILITGSDQHRQGKRGLLPFLGGNELQNLTHLILEHRTGRQFCVLNKLPLSPRRRRGGGRELSISDSGCTMRGHGGRAYTSGRHSCKQPQSLMERPGLEDPTYSASVRVCEGTGGMLNAQTVHAPDMQVLARNLPPTG